MARVLKRSHSFICTPRIHPLTEWTIPAFAFPAEAGTHLPTPEGWTAELALVAGWLHTEINVRHRELNQDAVAHLSTNRARRWLTSLIKANALTTTPDHQPQMRYQAAKQVGLQMSSERQRGELWFTERLVNCSRWLGLRLWNSLSLAWSLVEIVTRWEWNESVSYRWQRRMPNSHQPSTSAWLRFNVPPNTL